MTDTKHEKTRKASHTPGPWEVFVQEHGENGRHDPVNYYVQSAGGLPIIARIHEQYYGATEANARLICAAPKLPEALQTILQQASNISYHTPHLGQDFWDDARIAVAEATNDSTGEAA